MALARFAASLSLFGILVCIHMNFTLGLFLPSESRGIMDAMYVFFFAGTVLGAVLCPLFLPYPKRKNKPLLMGICFIAFLMVLEFIFRCLGFRVWLGSAALRNIMAIPEGIATTMCYGLFYLPWLQRTRPAEASGLDNRTGKFCSFFLGAALLVSVLIRYYSVPLLEAGIAAADPLKGAEFAFNFIKWGMIVMGVSAAVSVYLTRKADAAFALTGEDLPAEPGGANSGVKTNWPMILQLFSLASVFTILNGVLNMRALLPLYYDEIIYHPHFLTVAAVVPVLGLLAGRSTARFIRWFLPPAVILFILISCLPLFENHPQFNVIMSTLLSIAHYTVWIVFTTAAVEYYSGGFWFYGMATVIFFSVVFAFISPIIGPFVPDGAEYRVLFTVIAAVLFMILAFRLIIPKPLPAQAEPAAVEPQDSKIAAKSREAFSERAAREDIFKGRRLSRREIEVANLLIKEGLGNKEIGERLYISAGTAKVHISKIYQKFAVNNQREFMALFVNREE